MFRRLLPLLCSLLLLLPIPSLSNSPSTNPQSTRLHSVTPQSTAYLSQIANRKSQFAIRKIFPSLLKAVLLDPRSSHDFIVYLREQADLNAAINGEVTVLARREKVIAALQTTAERTQRDIRVYLARQQQTGHVRRYTPFWIFNGLAVSADTETLLELAARPEVASIRPDRKIYLTNGERRTANGEWRMANHKSRIPTPQSTIGNPQLAIHNRQSAIWNISLLGADKVWSALGIDGSGVVVANVDTGVDWQHPALQTRYRGYRGKDIAVHTGNWYCTTGEGADAYPVDGYGHGTHTMGTIVGGEGIGMAPGAQWIAVKAFSNQGYAYDSWIHAAFQWLLAPAGDPALAPDVVNNSWGSSVSKDETFRPDLQALRAAGILPVFSAGNEGPDKGSIGSPGSLSEALTVGATTSDDEVAYFSSRGPSPWGEIKPEVVAPGVGIFSALPGGGYGKKNGTSMAAPHVTGLVALLLQADPTLTITRTEWIITSTAVPLSPETPLPNNTWGWGRVDAYRAVVAVAAAGVLSGTVRRSVDGGPIPGATVTIVPHEKDQKTLRVLQVSTDDQGRYQVYLAPDTYEITVSAFGYASSTAYGVTIITRTTTLQDFSLSLLPVGYLGGRVTDMDTGAPLSATIYVEGTPAQATTDPNTGLYSLALPGGTYELRVTSRDHRVAHATVTIITDSITTHDFSLEPAPSILLVDSGAWYYRSEIDYYQQALGDTDYLYDLWTIKDPFTDVPSTTHLLPYDIVIWSCPLDSPGYVGAGQALMEYLDAGGRLFLSGQDVAFWDVGYLIPLALQFMYDYLKVQYVDDNAPTRSLVGQPGDIFADLTLTIEGGDGADNQSYPDIVAVTDAEAAASVLRYHEAISASDQGSGGQRVGLCLPYRAVFLSFGFEAINDRATRAEVMERTINWLVSPRRAWGLSLTPTEQTLVAPAGSLVTHTLRLRNTGELLPTDTFTLSLSSHRWPTTLLSPTVPLSPCAVAYISVTTGIPPDMAWNEKDTVIITAQSTLSPTLWQTVTLTTKTPAPILLVDDDRWYDQQPVYRAALDSQSLPYDVWDVGGKISPQRPSVPTDTLRWYSQVIWFTGYDWYQTLTPADEAALRAYLDDGGRLFLSGQDYLYTTGLTDFARDYLGVGDYTEDLTVTQVIGVPGHPVSDGLGPYVLEYPFLNWSDSLSPTTQAQVVFLSQRDLPVALSLQRVPVSPDYAPARTLFFAFPFESLPPVAANEVMGRIVGWLSDLGTSTFSVDKILAAEGERLTYTAVLVNDGRADINAVLFTATLPLSTTFVPGSLSPPQAAYDDGRITWHGPLARNQALTITYQADLADGIPPGTWVMPTVDIRHGDQGITFHRWTRTRVNAPDLEPSTFTVAPTEAQPGDVLTYTLIVRNQGVIDAPAVSISMPVPAYTAFLSGLLHTGTGAVPIGGPAGISWHGPVPLGDAVTITCRVVITSPRRPLRIQGRAYLDDGYGMTITRQAVAEVPPYRVRLVLIFKNYAPMQATPIPSPSTPTITPRPTGTAVPTRTPAP